LASNLETSKQFFGGDLSAAVKQAAQTPSTQDG